MREKSAHSGIRSNGGIERDERDVAPFTPMGARGGQHHRLPYTRAFTKGYIYMRLLAAAASSSSSSSSSLSSSACLIVLEVTAIGTCGARKRAGENVGLCDRVRGRGCHRNELARATAHYPAVDENNRQKNIILVCAWKPRGMKCRVAFVRQRSKRVPSAFMQSATFPQCSSRNAGEGGRIIQILLAPVADGNVRVRNIIIARAIAEFFSVFIASFYLPIFRRGKSLPLPRIRDP